MNPAKVAKLLDLKLAKIPVYNATTNFPIR